MFEVQRYSVCGAFLHTTFASSPFFGGIYNSLLLPVNKNGITNILKCALEDKNISHHRRSVF